MSTVSANLHVKDENGNLYDVQPTTLIANVTGLQIALDGKVNTETGKGLSSNDYTTTEKNKLSGIEAQANRTVVDSALSGSSTNPIQNKIVKAALDTKFDTANVSTSVPASPTNNTVPSMKLVNDTYVSNSSFEQLKNYITPQMFGAVADGNADDTLAINQALLACNGEKDLFFPSGKYRVTSQINISKRIGIYGVLSTTTYKNSGGSEIIADFNEGAVFNIKAQGCKVKNLRFVSANENNNNINNFIAVKADYELAISSESRLTIESVYIRNFGTGIWIGDKCLFTDLTDCFCADCLKGYEIYAPTSLMAMKCWAKDCDQGYEIYNGQYCAYYDCASDGCDKSFYMENCISTSLIDCSVEMSANSPAFKFKDCNEIALLACFSYRSNINGIDDASFILSSNSKLTIISCHEHEHVRGDYSCKFTSSWAYLLGDKFHQPIYSDAYSRINGVYRTDQQGLVNYVESDYSYNKSKVFTHNSFDSADITGNIKETTVSGIVMLTFDLRFQNGFTADQEIELTDLYVAADSAPLTFYVSKNTNNFKVEITSQQKIKLTSYSTISSPAYFSGTITFAR